MKAEEEEDEPIDPEDYPDEPFEGGARALIARSQTLRSMIEAAASGDENWITLPNGQHLLLDKENYTLVQYRDENGKSLDKVKVFKYKNVEDAQVHAQRLLKQGLKNHDFSLWAPAK